MTRGKSGASHRGAKKESPAEAGLSILVGLLARILGGILRRRWRVALARRGRRGVALSALSGLHVLVGGGLIAALADRRLILRSGLSSRVLLGLWLLLIGRLLC